MIIFALSRYFSLDFWSASEPFWLIIRWKAQTSFNPYIRCTN